LAVQVAASLEKVDGREQQLNGQFDGLMVQYQDTRQQLLAAQEEYNRCAAAEAHHCHVQKGGPLSSVPVPAM
jgi:outer membrane murein-binding lipoprotein Lpp